MPKYDTVVTEAGMTLADNTTNDATTTKHGFLKKLDNTATNFMNGAGNWAAPAGTAVTASQAFLTGDVTLTDANTYYVGPTSTPAAGTYYVSGQVVVTDAASQMICARLTDGTTIYGEAQGPISATAISFALSGGPIVLDGATAVKISVATDSVSAAGRIKATLTVNGTTNKASSITLLKIA